MGNRYVKRPLDNPRIVELYQAGMTQAEVAEELGITQKLVWMRLRDEGVKCRPAIKRNQIQEFNNSWKGERASYGAFHRRLDATKGRPKKCEECQTTDPSKHYDWANLTGRYDDPSDYRRMCRSCHRKYDKGSLNFKGATGARSSPTSPMKSSGRSPRSKTEK